MSPLPTDGGHDIRKSLAASVCDDLFNWYNVRRRSLNKDGFACWRAQRTNDVYLLGRTMAHRNHSLSNVHDEAHVAGGSSKR